MFQSSRLIAICCLVGTMVAGCGGQQVQSRPGVVPPAQTSLARNSPHALNRITDQVTLPECGGSGITVSPCPLYLTTNGTYSEVTLSGYFDKQTNYAQTGIGCYETGFCNFTEYTNQLYAFSPVPNHCGKSYAFFAGDTDYDNGFAWITIIRKKKYCP